MSFCVRALTDNLNPRSSIVILISDLVGGTNRLQFFHTFRLGAHIDVDVISSIQDKAIAFIHRRHRQIDLTNTNIPLSLHLEQTFLALGVCLHVLKAATNTSLLISHAFDIIYDGVKIGKVP